MFEETVERLGTAILSSGGGALDVPDQWARLPPERELGDELRSP